MLKTMSIEIQIKIKTKVIEAEVLEHEKPR
jgi:hypothetical protein